jgi:multiple sugar transport system permease protein
MTATALPAPVTGTDIKDRPITAAGSPRGENRAGWLFASPFLAFYIAFLIGPVLVGLVISLFNTTTVRAGVGDWVGFSNYADVLSNKDFWASMWHSVLFTLLTTPFLVLLPMLFAVLASRISRNQWFFRLAFFAPYVVPSAAVCLIFAFMYTPETGLITNAFGWVGLTAVWWTFGFNFILYTAAIQEISEEVYEAATIDGAGPWQQIRHITIPLLRPTLGLVLVLQVLASLKVFDQIYILLAGGPAYSTRPVIQYIFDTGFGAYRGGYAAAATMVYFVILVLVSAAWFLLRRRSNSANA